MKRYTVTLEQTEREQLARITRKGSHAAQKVINALILLNCDESSLNIQRNSGKTISAVLQVSQRKVDRVKQRFVEEGLEVALGGRQGKRPSYVRKADAQFEAHLVALSRSEPPAGCSQWSLRLLADRAMQLNYIDRVSHETVRRVLKNNKSNLGDGSDG